MRKKILFISIVPVFLLVVAGLLLLLPLNSLRAPLERAVSGALGREVRIAGGLHASLYPQIGLSAGDVSIANVPGAQARLFAHVGRLAVGARLIPLLSREIDITELTLENPQIHLEVDGSGNPNWNLVPTKSGDASTSGPSRLSISGLKISNGEIDYYDARTARRWALRAANAGLSLAALDRPANFDGDALYNGDRLSVTGRIDSPDSYARKLPTRILLDLKSRLIALHFDGTVTGTSRSDGTVEISGPSLRELLQGVGAAAPKAAGLGAFSMAGAVSSRDRVYALKAAKLSLDGMHATVDLAVDTTGAVPALKGNIALDRLDVARYMAAKEPDTRSRGWSTEPLSLGGLKKAEADVGIAVGNLSVGTFAISHGAMRVLLRGGVLSADLTKAQLFNGSAAGRVVVDARDALPNVAVKLDVKSVAMKALLQSAMKVERIEGTGTLALNVAGYGSSQQAIMRSLKGTSSVTVKNGAIRGVDLAAVARSLQSALAGALGGATGEKSSTDFAEAGGTFVIAGGVMHNKDFHLLSPFVRIIGNGDIDLGRRTLDFHIEPKLVATRQGQGSALGAAGIGVPFQISGPWTKPSYRPDMKAVGKAVVEQVVGGGNGIGGVLGNVLGGNKSAAGQPRKQPGFDLGGLLGR